MVRWSLFVAIALLPPWVARAGGPADDEPRPPAATVVVDLVPGPGVPAWFASAFEQSVARELSGFARLSLAAKERVEPARACGAELGCRLAAYQGAGIDVILSGRVDRGQIEFELYQTWTPARISTGVIEIGRSQSLIGLQHATLDALHPVLKHGGLLDQGGRSLARGDPAAVDRAGWSGFEIAIFLVAAIVLSLPFLLAAALLRARPRPILAMRTARRVLAVAGVAALAGLAVEPAELGRAVASWRWVAAGVGGIGWGLFLVGWFRAVFPPLDGLARLAYRDLARMLATWCLAGVERLILLAAMYAPFVWLSVWLADELALPALWTVALLAPGVLLLARLWYASWVECLAAVLDRRLVSGVATDQNPWSREISDYLGGYVRRTGWDLEAGLLADVVFLPGKEVHGQRVVSYGGGAARTRIVIDEALLVLTMGPLVEVKPEERTALWPDWTAANAMPRPGQRGRGRQRASTSLDDFRGRKQRLAYPGVQRKPLGVPATLLGYVTPSPGQVVPLISDSPQDLAVVRELLSEHYRWFAPDPDDEFDATDPTDKDLLFGALARELGAVRRHETQLATVKLSLGRVVARLAARYRTRLADTYPAVTFARDHFIQFLYYLSLDEPDVALLTSRGPAERLAATSQRMLRAVALVDPTKQRARRAVRTRLAWLSRYFPEPIVDRRAALARRAVGLAVVVASLAAVFAVVKRSIDYDPVYVERISAQERDLAAARQREADEQHQRGAADGEANQE